MDHQHRLKHPLLQLLQLLSNEEVERGEGALGPTHMQIAVHRVPLSFIYIYKTITY